MCDWKIAIATADYSSPTMPILLNGSMCDNLQKAAKLGFDAIEVHVRENVMQNFTDIISVSEQCNVVISAIVTGRLNTEGQCSLLDDRPYVERATIDGLKRYIETASKLKTDLIIGWVKGIVPEGKDRTRYIERLARSLAILDRYAYEAGIYLYLEVLNRYETNIFNTAKEIIIFLKNYELKNCRIHLDTFHMNIEETNMVEAILSTGDYLGYFHLADNTRCAIGTGNLDIEKILNALKRIEYNGYIAIECLPVPDGLTAASQSLFAIEEYYKNTKKKI